MHSIINPNQWYDCVIDPHDNDCDIQNLVIPDKEKNDTNFILATNITTGK